MTWSQGGLDKIYRVQLWKVSLLVPNTLEKKTDFFFLSYHLNLAFSITSLFLVIAYNLWCYHKITVQIWSRNYSQGLIHLTQSSHFLSFLQDHHLINLNKLVFVRSFHYHHRYIKPTKFISHSMFFESTNHQDFSKLSIRTRFTSILYT